MDKNAIPPGLPRRDFIRKTAAAAAAVAATPLLKTPVYGQETAPSANVIGANDRIAVAVIGVGEGIGQNHVVGIHQNEKQTNTVLAAASDLFTLRREFAQKNANLKDSDVYEDYRKILDRKDIDAVVIAAHDIWHAQISMDAAQAGKHVYCEKPLTRYLDEAYKVHAVIKATKVRFQVGAQGCSAGGWHKCADLIKSGDLGKLVWSQGYYCRNSKEGEWNWPFDRECTAENVNWDVWQGRVHERVPFNQEDFYRWRKYYRYSSGPLTDLVPHRLLPLMLASGNPEFPSRVVCIGTNCIHPDRVDNNPERETPEHEQFIAEFPSGYLITIVVSTVNARSPGFVLYTHKASLEVATAGDRIQLLPERPFADDIDPTVYPGPAHPESLAPEDIRTHEKNFFDCIRSGKECNANVDLALQSQAVISLAEMSQRLKKAFLYDGKSRTISDNEGNKIDPITYGTLPLS